MDVAVPSRPAGTQSASSDAREQRNGLPGLPMVVLPVLTRSISLLTLLLQDSAIDLELASSVVGLDPGLAFAALQLANRKRAEGGDTIWQLPMAVVEAGRDALEQYVQRAPTIEAVTDAARRRLLERLAIDAAMRACVAHLLARELGQCNPRKAFLCGLLFELPLVAHCGHSAVCSAEALLPAMCRVLPARIVRAAMVGQADDQPAGEPLLAAVLLADVVVQTRQQARSKNLAALPPALDELTASPLWSGWNEIATGQRSLLLQHSWDIGAWAATSLHRMAPWEFMARLECRNSGR